MTIAVALVAAGVAWAGEAGTVPRAPVIPLPEEMKLAEGTFTIGPKAEICVRHGSSGGIEVARFLQTWIRERTGCRLRIRTVTSPGAKENSILLSTRGLSTFLGEEGYELVVGSRSVILRARTQAGLFYASQSLRQLLTRVPWKKGDEFWTLPRVRIVDRPRFAWRGMHLDCARHFMSVKFVKRFIDLIAFYKFNRFHWHLTEDQGWRLEIKKYPRLTKVGAWRMHGKKRYGGYYTQKQAREIVRYAAERNVMVVPEIEMPGHTQAALAAYPELSCKGGPFKVSNRWGIHKDIYCAGNDETFRFLEDVLSEVVELFPAPFIHLGADEAPKHRWKACPKCQRRMDSEGLRDERELQAYFVRTVARFLKGKGRRVIAWDEVLQGGGPPEDVVVQAWRGYKRGVDGLKAGHDVIFSPYSHVYFDYSPEHFDLPLVYSFDPISEKLAREYHDRVLGGEGCVWTEGITEDRADYKVFPRTIGLAEVLWSPEAKRDFDGFYRRLEVHRGWLNDRGVVMGPAIGFGPESKVRLIRPGRVKSTMPVHEHYTPDRAFDGSVDSYFWSKRGARKGDTLTVSLEDPVKASEVEALTGFGYDALRKGVLEISADGKDFIRVAKFRNGRAAGSFEPRQVKAFRIRATASQKNAWLVVREMTLK